MPTYMSHSNWNGSLKEGSGEVSVGSGAFDTGVAPVPQKGEVTNPEEIVGAALASCYGLMLAKTLGDADVTVRSIETTAAVDVDQDDATPGIAKIALDVDVRADDLDQQRLKTFAERAKATCPVAKSLGGTDISVDPKLRH